MRKFILASAVAAVASVSFGASAFADGVVVRLGDAPHHHHYRHDRVIERVDGMHPRHHRDCMTKTVIRHHNGERIVKKTRVCR